MATYIVGDIHGCLDDWLELKNKIESQDPHARFVLVGDIVDRGPQVYETLQWAMQNITENGKYQMVLGNHEDMKIDWWNSYKQASESLAEDKTVDYRDFRAERYGFDSVMSKAGLDDKQVEEIINFFESLPLYKEIDVNLTNGKGIHKRHYIIVHAGLRYSSLTTNETIRKDVFKPYSKTGELINYTARKNREEMLWSRNSIGYDLLRKSIVVHGHTPTFDMDLMESGAVPGQIHFLNNSINVDCGLYFREYFDSNLAAIRLEDLAEFYVYEITEDQLEDENQEINKQRKEEMLQWRKPNKKVEDVED